MLRIGSRRIALPASALPTPILVIGSVMSLALLGDSLLYVALPAHAAELALPLWAVGVLLGANRIVRLVTNGLAATLFNRVGGRGPVVAAGVGSVVTTAMYGLMPTFWPLLLARFAWGACFSTLRLGAFTVVLAASQPSTRGRLVGLYQSISRIGPVASLLIGGLMVETLGYHVAFVILGVVTAPAILLALILPSSAYRADLTPRPPLRRGEGEQGGHGRGAIHRARSGVGTLGWRERWLGGRHLVAVKLGMLANGFTSQGVILATLTLALTEVAGSPEGAAAIGGLLVAFRWGADLFLAPGFGHLSDRIGRGRMIPALLVVEAVAVAGLSLATDRTAVIAAALAVFLTSTALTAASDAAAGDLAPPERRAEVMSGYSDWIDIGAALGPPLAFVLAERLGLFPSYGCTAVLLLVVAGWFVAAWRHEPTSH
jgi:MFS family permease